MKALISAILLLVVMETAKAADHPPTLTLTCPDRYGPTVFLLDLDGHSVVSAIEQSFGKSRFMFGGVPLAATETELVWIWKSGYTDLGGGSIKGVIRKYILERSTVELTTEVLINREYHQFKNKCYLAKRTLFP
jgi:hypothetical protein